MADKSSKQPSATSQAEVLGVARGIGGAVLGAAAGVIVFMVLLNFGLYAIAAIGALTGLGCSLLSQRRSLVLAFICLVVALTTTFFNEWLNNPFTDDPSLTFFLQNIGPKSLFWLSLLLGGGLSIWIGQGNERTTSRSSA